MTGVNSFIIKNADETQLKEIPLIAEYGGTKPHIWNAVISTIKRKYGNYVTSIKVNNAKDDLYTIIIKFPNKWGIALSTLYSRDTLEAMVLDDQGFMTYAHPLNRAYVLWFQYYFPLNDYDSAIRYFDLIHKMEDYQFSAPPLLKLDREYLIGRQIIVDLKLYQRFIQDPMIIVMIQKLDSRSKEIEKIYADFVKKVIPSFEQPKYRSPEPNEENKPSLVD